MTQVLANSVWVFMGQKGRMPSAVFVEKDQAEAWIKSHRLTGLLTRYPLNESVYDWAIQSGHFEPKLNSKRAPDFIGGFSSAQLEHYHYQDGV